METLFFNSCREEQVAYDALKKQMVFYQHTPSQHFYVTAFQLFC